MTSQNYKSIYDACVKFSQNKSIKTIVDLGACHGEGYELFGRFYPNASYTFVEPSNRCIHYINEIIKKYPDNKLNLIDGVLGTKNSQTAFYQLEHDNDQSGNLFSNRGGQYGKSTECIVKTYDYREIFTHIDFVKCNIEGAEYQLIEDGFFDIVDSFVMEAHNIHVPNKNYRNILSALGDKFELSVWGNVNYKYCFINGQKK
jgi:FkbM family methyltransferase